MKLSLRVKISIVAVIPSIAFLTMVFFQMQVEYKKVKIADKIKKNAGVFYVTSKLIHELQKERGLSVGFLNKGIPEEMLTKQILKMSEVIENFHNSLHSENYETSSTQNLNTVLLKLENVRKSIKSQSVMAKDVFEFYTSLVILCFQVENETVNIEDTDGILSRTRSLLVLEEAKEQAGQLRALMTATISSNKVIENSQVEKISEYLGGVTAHLNSPATVFLDNTKKGISSFNSSEDWLSVKNSAVSIIRLSNQGNFGISAPTFFSVITK